MHVSWVAALRDGVGLQGPYWNVDRFKEEQHQKSHVVSIRGGGDASNRLAPTSTPKIWITYDRRYTDEIQQTRYLEKPQKA